MRHPRTFRPLCASLLAVAVLSACSSNSSEAKTASTGGSSAGGTSSFEASLASYTTKPTSAGSAPAVTQPIPNGKSFVQISNGSAYDQALSTGLKEALPKIGWKFTVLQAKLSDPSTTLSALTTAVNAGADFALVTATPIAVWQSVLPLARAHHTTVIAYAGAEDPRTDPAPPGVIHVQNGVTVGTSDGRSVMAAALADLGSGSDAELASIDIPQLGATSSSFTTAAKAELAGKCASCTLNTIQIPFGDIQAGKGTQDVVTYLQSHPKTKYVLVLAGQAVSGLSQAVRAAALPPVKILGAVPAPDQIKDVAAGDSLAWVVTSLRTTAWEVVDAAVRTSVGAPVYDWPPLKWMITKSNAGQVTDPSDPEFPDGYQAEFAKTWGKPT